MNKKYIKIHKLLQFLLLLFNASPANQAQQWQISSVGLRDAGFFFSAERKNTINRRIPA